MGRGSGREPYGDEHARAVGVGGNAAFNKAAEGSLVD